MAEMTGIRDTFGRGRALGRPGQGREHHLQARSIAAWAAVVERYTCSMVQRHETARNSIQHYCALWTTPSLSATGLPLHPAPNELGYRVPALRHRLVDGRGPA
jgi:hypothetical protein